MSQDKSEPPILNENPYEAAWDKYVRRFRNSNPEGTPGNEWGDERIWEFRFDTLFRPYGIDCCRMACEIGAGSGKYTRKVLNHAEARIICADISEDFLSVLRQEMNTDVDAGSVIPVFLKTRRPDELLTHIVDQGMCGYLDFFYSIDTMVHIDLQSLIAYWITAALTLKPGGKMVMTLADPSTDRGRQKLVEDIIPYYHQRGFPGLRFAWISKDLVVNLLEKIGFCILRCDNPAPAGLKPRDMFVAAERVDLEKAETFRKYICKAEST
jgi:hypothetical protein